MDTYDLPKTAKNLDFLEFWKFDLGNLELAPSEQTQNCGFLNTKMSSQH